MLCVSSLCLANPFYIRTNFDSSISLISGKHYYLFYQILDLGYVLGGTNTEKKQGFDLINLHAY